MGPHGLATHMFHSRGGTHAGGTVKSLGSGTVLSAGSGSQQAHPFPPEPGFLTNLLLQSLTHRSAVEDAAARLLSVGKYRVDSSPYPYYPYLVARIQWYTLP